MKKQKLFNGLCLVLAVCTLIAFVWGLRLRSEKLNDRHFTDGVTQIDPDTIFLEGSKVEVNFSEVLLSEQKESRKLIVSEQTGTVSTLLTDRLIQKLDFDFLKKTQQVSYTGKGYFVVDLDKLTKGSILQDKENRTVTIRIGHAYLQAIEIDPDKIIIDEVKQGLLARGDIELSVADYNIIEKDLRSRLEKQFNTAENGQKADDLALKMVRSIFEPIVQAIDSRYIVMVEFL